MPKLQSQTHNLKSCAKTWQRKPQGLRGLERLLLLLLLLHGGARASGEHGGAGRAADRDGHGGGRARRPRAAVVEQGPVEAGLRQPGGGRRRGGEADSRTQPRLHRPHCQRRHPGTGARVH